MKKLFESLYWCLAVVALSLILIGEVGSFGAAFFLSVMLLPGVLFVKYSSKDISFKDRRTGILHSIYMACITMLIEYLAIIFVYWNLYGFELPTVSSIVLNPVFIWFVLAALLAFEKLLRMKLIGTDEPEREKFIRFISGRRQVSLAVGSILYIESRDYEVEVVTESEGSYPTRMKISQWEAALDDRFVRIHRSFIVNRSHVARFDSRYVHVGGRTIEMSRKYREQAVAKLDTAKASVQRATTPPVS